MEIEEIFIIFVGNSEGNGKLEGNKNKRIAVEWLTVSFTLFVFYEIVWMLLDSTAGENDFFPTKWECITDFFVCAVQTLPCIYVLNVSKSRIMSLPTKSHITLSIFAILFFANLFAAIPVTSVEFFVYKYIHHVDWSIADHLLNDILLSIVSSLLLAILLLRRCAIDLKKANDKSIKEQKVIAETRIMALQSQIDPHFLFNCLSTCVGLIDMDTNKAKEFITNLADVYRHILQNTEHYYVDIHDEITNLERYLSLIATRYGSVVHISIDKRLYGLDTYVLRGALQLLVENAIKHNRRSIKQPLHIRVYADDKSYIIENDYRPIPNAPLSTQIGQENIKRQYNAIGFNTVRFAVNKGKYIAQIPIIRHEDINH